MRPRIILAGAELDQMVRLSLLNPSGSYLMIETDQPVAALLAPPLGEADAIVAFLSGHENVADLQALLAAYAPARCLLLVPDSPPHAAIARVVDRYGGAILPRNEAQIVVMATLLGLLSGAVATN
jgi:hypothetical protein